MMDQAKVLREMAGAGDGRRRDANVSPRIVTVASGKGGVGKTSLSVNLGIALASRGMRTVLIDADIGLANVDIALGIRPTYTLRHVLFEERTLAEAVIDGPGGLKVLAGGSGVHELEGMDAERMGRFAAVLESMDENYDFMLIDTGAGVGPHVLSFATAGSETMMVVTPDPSSIADAYAVMKAAERARARHVRWHIAVNMVRSADEGLATFQRLAAAARRFLDIEPVHLGSVPRDEAVLRAGQRQRPFVLDAPRSGAGRAVMEMAAKLSDEPSPPALGLGNFMRRLFRIGN